jgi:hypothetical protein
MIREPVTRMISFYHFLMNLYYGQAHSEDQQLVRWQRAEGTIERFQRLKQHDHWLQRNWFIQPWFAMPNLYALPYPPYSTWPLDGATWLNRTWSFEEFVEFMHDTNYGNYLVNAFSGALDGSYGVRSPEERLETAKHNLLQMEVR